MKRNRTFILLFPIAILILFGCTQSSDELKSLGEKLDSLQKGQDSIKTELADLKKTLQTRPSPASRKTVEAVNAVIDIDKDPYKGKADAMVTLLDFSDYE